MNDKAYQTSFSNSLNNLWVLDSLSSNSNSYALQNANILSNGLGLGSIISGTSYYALEGSGASVSSISVTYDAVTGTYTFKRSVNGLTYALGINNQSTSTGEFASWSPYSANNASQKWYLETANYRSGDADYDGTITQYDKTRLCEKISVNSKTVIKMLLSERLYSAAQIFLQYTMDTVICQGSLDISLLEWSAAEWNQADIRRFSRSCRDT